MVLNRGQYNKKGRRPKPTPCIHGKQSGRISVAARYRRSEGEDFIQVIVAMLLGEEASRVSERFWCPQHMFRVGVSNQTRTGQRGGVSPECSEADRRLVLSFDLKCPHTIQAQRRERLARC